MQKNLSKILTIFIDIILFIGCLGLMPWALCEFTEKKEPNLQDFLHLQLINDLELAE